MRVYVATAIFDVPVGASMDLLEITAPAAGSIEIIGLNVGNLTEEGDAQSEMLRLEGWRGFTSSGSGGEAVTPALMAKGSPASAATVEAANTTLASGGSPQRVLHRAWNVQLPFEDMPTPDGRISLEAGESFVLRLTEGGGGSPADVLTVAVEAKWIERGS